MNYRITNRVVTNVSAPANTIHVEVTDELLARMTPEQRDVVVRFQSGESFKSIAASLGLAEMSVRTRFQRGIQAGLNGRKGNGNGNIERGIGGLTPNQIERLELLAQLGSVQKVADALGLNNQMTVRSSLNRAADILGASDIWDALKRYQELKTQEDRTGKVCIKVDGVERWVSTNNDNDSNA